MNLQIKSFFFMIGFLITLVLLSVLLTVHQIIGSYEGLDKLDEKRLEMNNYATLIRNSSDQLSKYARLYVVTQRKEYKDIYYNILDIRNGLKPRPQKYEHIYWDLLEPHRSKRHPLAKKKGLDSILKELPYDAYEYKKLQEAKNNSNELVSLEIEAFNAMVGLYKNENGKYSVYAKKNQQKAIKLLHSKQYLQAKEKIMLPLDLFLAHLDSRAENGIVELKKDIKFLTLILIMLIAILFTLFLSILIAIRKKILNPILYLSESIYEFKNRKKSTRDDKRFYDDEIGYMSEQFYSMRDSIIEDNRVLSLKERKISEYLSLVDKNVIISSTDLNGKITNVSEAYCELSGFSKDELLSKNYYMIKHPDMLTETLEDLWNTIKSDKVWQGELKNLSKDERTYWLQSRISPLYNIDNEKIGYTAISTDITNKKLVQELLELARADEAKLQDYVDTIDKNIITSSTDLNGNINYVSDAFCKISGYSRMELMGNNHSMVKHSDMSSEIYDDLWDSIANNRTWHGEIKNKTKNGDYYWVEATVYPVFNNHGEKVGYTAIRIDITDKKRVEELLIYDGLTGIYNRRHFNESLPKAINIAKRDKKYFSFLILDIDNFKLYNDTYGHQEGDHVLIQVAKAIQDSLKRGMDMCFRLGGEEFGVVYESLNPQNAYEFAETIRANIENLKLVHEKNTASPYVTVSMGLVTKKSTEKIIDDEIYKEADTYLYKAKESGRNKVEANER